MANVLLNLFGLIAIILLSYLGGELVGRLKLPKVIGYLLIGMIIGPYALELVDPDAFNSAIYKIILLIAIGLVGYSISSGIRVQEIKKFGAKIFVIAFFEAYTPFVLVALAMYYILHFDMPSALVIGAIALPTAPVVALSIHQEYKTDGLVTRALLPIVAIDDVFAVATFGIILSFAGAYYSGEELAIIDPFIEIFASFIVGGLFGFFGYFILRAIHSLWSMRIVTISLILLTMFVGIYFHTDLMITGISFGLVLVNSLKEEQLGQFKEANHALIGLAIILFLTVIGGTLDITAILSLTALAGALVYFVVRATGKLAGARIGAIVAKSEPVVQKYLGPTLLAAAGVSLTFVGIATPVIPSDQAMRMGVMVAAAALINEIVAVFATKWGFQKAGEINKASFIEPVSSKTEEN
jgi:Kef-type K+ transport system membrane component KefB